MTGAKEQELLKPGASIGKSATVIDIVDGGGKEPVYIVWHREAWCPMACKVFRSHARAKREANILGKLTHPYIVRFLALEAPSLLFMEFVEGPTLANLIDEAQSNRLGVSDAIRVAIHVGAALCHTHRQGFIHLDVKPANVIVGPGGRPVLFDFGSARQIGSKRPDTVKAPIFTSLLKNAL